MVKKNKSRKLCYRNPFLLIVTIPACIVVGVLWFMLGAVLSSWASMKATFLAIMVNNKDVSNKYWDDAITEFYGITSKGENK